MSMPFISPTFSRSLRLEVSLSNTILTRSSRFLLMVLTRTRARCLPLGSKCSSSFKRYKFWMTSFRKFLISSLYWVKISTVRILMSFCPSSSISTTVAFNFSVSCCFCEACSSCSNRLASFFSEPLMTIDLFSREMGFSRRILFSGRRIFIKNKLH